METLKSSWVIRISQRQHYSSLYERLTLGRNKEAVLKLVKEGNMILCLTNGVPNIFNVWKDEGWVEPRIEEQFNPDRTVLSLAFIKKQAIKTSDKKISKKIAENIEKIRKYLDKRGKSKTSDIADHIGLSPARTRAILSEMEDVQTVGKNKNRRYNLVK